MKTKTTYRTLLIAGAFLTALFFHPSQPVAASPPGVYFHTSFHVGTSFYAPVVSYSARIRMFSYPSVTVGYLYDPIYYDPWYGGGGYYYNSGYGAFSVTFSFGYPSYYYAPVWYYPVAYYPPVYYYPPVHIWPYPGPYYSYHYGWHSGCGYYDHPYYDRHYHSYGSRSAEYMATNYRPASRAASYSSRAGNAAGHRPDQYGTRSRSAAAGTGSRYAHRNATTSRSQAYEPHASHGNAGTLRRAGTHSRSASASPRSVATHRRSTGRYGRQVPSSAHRQNMMTSHRSPGVTARRSTTPAATTHRTSPSYVGRASTAAYRHTPPTIYGNRNMQHRTANAPATSHRSDPGQVKSMHTTVHPSRPAGAGSGAPSSRRSSAGRSTAPGRR